MYTQNTPLNGRSLRARALLILVAAAVLLAALGAATPRADAADCRAWHTVQRGETLYRIGLKYNLTWDKIAKANGIANANKVYAGQQLCIPKSESTSGGGSGTLPPPDVVLVLGTDVKEVRTLTDVNVRVGPSMDYKSVGKIIMGQTVKVTGISADQKWWRVDCPANSGAKDCFITAGAQYTQPVGQPGSQPGNPPAGAIPTFSISAVVRDQTVTISTRDFPANVKFDVRMGALGTQGINGAYVTTIDSGAGGSFSQTFNVPAGLRGSDRIAIRLENASGYYAYNWFWNNSTQ